MTKKRVTIISIDSSWTIPDDVGTYPFKFMDVGDSFAFGLDKLNSVKSAASRYGKENDKVFTVRKMDKKTARAWRVQ